MTESETAILHEAIQTIWDRQATHGEPEDSFGVIAELWSSYLRAANGLEADADTDASARVVDGEDVASMMILLKVARNANGPYLADTWVDVAGYAENAALLAGDE